MKAICFNSPRELYLGEVERPKLEDAADAIVQVHYAAICGSDLHPYRGAEKGLKPGTVMGHEFVGKVVQIGDAVKDIQVGDSVICPFTSNCGDCFFCKNDLSCRCVKGQLFGWVSEESGCGLQGGQAEFVRVPFADSTLVKVPDHLDMKKAILLGDILSTGFFCAIRGDILANTREGDGVVAVIGCGPVGLLTVASAAKQSRPSCRVVAIDCVPARLEAAMKLGATDVINFAKLDAAEAVRLISRNQLGADVVLEAVGQPSAMRLALDCLRPGGTLSSVGVHAYEKNELSPVEAYDKNITFRSGRCPARTMLENHLDQLVEIVQGMDDSVLFTHSVSIEGVVEAYKTFDKQEDGMIKCLIEMQAAKE